jgi:LytTr DNA-binding domain-containing protein
MPETQNVLRVGAEGRNATISQCGGWWQVLAETRQPRQTPSRTQFHGRVNARLEHWEPRRPREAPRGTGLRALAVNGARMHLAAFEARLPPGRSVRVHRSLVVNLSRIRRVEPWFHGDYLLVMADGGRVVTGATRRGRVRAALGLP